MGALNKRQNREAFTLLELLIVIGIIAILAAALYVALNPGARLRDSRDARRLIDVKAIISAIKIDQVDNGGSYFPTLNASPPTVGTIYQITSVPTSAVWNAPGALCNRNCTAFVTAVANCVNFDSSSIYDLTDEGYLSSIPISPTPPGVTPLWAAPYSGYWIRKNTNGTVTVGACSGEGQTISLSE